MKIAISAVSEDLNQQVNPVFGRCPGYIIVEIENKEIKSHIFVQNQAATAATGAGIAAAQAIIGQGVQIVISSNFGPNAFMLLQQSKIKLYQVHGLTIKDALQQLIDEKLPEMGQSSAPSKFGMGAGGKSSYSSGLGKGYGIKK